MTEDDISAAIALSLLESDSWSGSVDALPPPSSSDEHAGAYYSSNNCSSSSHHQPSVVNAILAKRKNLRIIVPDASTAAGSGFQYTHDPQTPEQVLCAEHHVGDQGATANSKTGSPTASLPPSKKAKVGNKIKKTTAKKVSSLSINNMTSRAE
jgi:hypothetical protein